MFLQDDTNYLFLPVRAYKCKKNPSLYSWYAIWYILVHHLVRKRVNLVRFRPGPGTLAKSAAATLRCIWVEILMRRNPTMGCAGIPITNHFHQAGRHGEHYNREKVGNETSFLDAASSHKSQRYRILGGPSRGEVIGSQALNCKY